MAFQAAVPVLPDPHHLYLAVKVCAFVRLHLRGHTDIFVAAATTPNPSSFSVRVRVCGRRAPAPVMDALMGRHGTEEDHREVPFMATRVLFPSLHPHPPKVHHPPFKQSFRRELILCFFTIAQVIQLAHLMSP